MRILKVKTHQIRRPGRLGISLSLWVKTQYLVHQGLYLHLEARFTPCMGFIREAKGSGWTGMPLAALNPIPDTLFRDPLTPGNGGNAFAIGKPNQGLDSAKKVGVASARKNGLEFSPFS